ncbi:ABC transporter ATP-binding protein [Butyrivibrio sp. MC2013]|uniref:ABC transporter ATP-binding protein n=1 Tax=Butyrivibrio sp. MC2013 TaxID=1280686 RepID=UPI00041DAE53|nr:dipeptide/oligopeptide/nickel ABC transporter ATP-binding protein [Butyrivibrio sp. MC2013]
MSALVSNTAASQAGGDVWQGRARSLEISGLNVYYKNNKKSIFEKRTLTHAVKDVDLVMYKGEVLGLAGESGCGKSSLARTIVGINKNYTGTIKKTDPYPQMIFQDPYGSLNPCGKVGWILKESLRADRKKRRSEEEMDMRIRKAMEDVELPVDFLERYPSQLSGGQRQRVSIALSLVQDPEILIADEPVSALDVTIQAQILRLLDDLHRKLDLSILFISHDLRVVYNICDHVAVMRNGIIEEYGETDCVYRNPRAEYTRELLRSAGI